MKNIKVGDKFLLIQGKLFYRRVQDQICQGPQVWASPGTVCYAVGWLKPSKHTPVGRVLVKTEIQGAPAYAWAYYDNLEPA
jgi:hypothetical protein